MLWKVEYKSKPGRIYSFDNPDKDGEKVCLKDGETFECNNEPLCKGPGITIFKGGEIYVPEKKEVKKVKEEKPEEKPAQIAEEKEDEKPDDKADEKPADKKAKKKKRNRGIGGRQVT